MTDQQSPATGQVDGEMIVGAPSRAGDKPDTDVQQQPEMATTPTPSTQPIFGTAQSAVASAAAAQPSVETSATPVAAASALPPTNQRPDGSELDRGEKLLAGLGYIGILALVPLLLRRDSAYCRHHGSQGLVLGAVLTVAEAMSQLLGLLLPGFHGFITILMLVAWIAGFALAFSGSWFRIPVIIDWADQLNLFTKKMDREERLQNSAE